MSRGPWKRDLVAQQEETLTIIPEPLAKPSFIPSHKSEIKDFDSVAWKMVNQINQYISDFEQENPGCSLVSCFPSGADSRLLFIWKLA
jgi:hypothetical protein